jgi:hypothetical protein
VELSSYFTFPHVQALIDVVAITAELEDVGYIYAQQSALCPDLTLIKRVAGIRRFLRGPHLKKDICGSNTSLSIIQPGDSANIKSTEG